MVSGASNAYSLAATETTFGAAVGSSRGSSFSPFAQLDSRLTNRIESGATIMCLISEAPWSSRLLVWKRHHRQLYRYRIISIAAARRGWRPAQVPEHRQKMHGGGHFCHR